MPVKLMPGPMRRGLLGTTALWLCMAAPGAAMPIRVPNEAIAAQEAALAARIADARRAMGCAPSDADVQLAQYFPWNNFAPQFSNFPNFPNAVRQFPNYTQQYQGRPSMPPPGYGYPPPGNPYGQGGGPQYRGRNW